MKNIFAIFLVYTIIFSFVRSVEAATAKNTTPSPTTAEKDDKLNSQINQLKEKIASRVAELNLVEKRGVIGAVTEVSAHQITITDLAGKNRLIDVDEITKFSSPTDKSFGLSDIKKGMKISALGLYNKQSKRILARFISVTATTNFLSGAVSEIDKKNFVVTVASEDQKQTKVDIQTSTKILTQDKDAELAKSGFSKIAVGNRVFIVGAPDAKDPNLFTATRLIVLPELPEDPNIVLTQPTTAPVTTEAITPSTGNGKKLTPIR